ncbi:MAG: hypothetical protein MUP69_04735 [Candidatus Atribacteria bacterium]|nr:hypothetical protein [Candidatus Atribacteria bacterium]
MMIPLAIEEKVENLKDINSIFELFEYLGYKKYLYDKTYKRDKIDFGIPKDVIPNIENIYFLYSKSDTNDVFFKTYLFGA